MPAKQEWRVWGTTAGWGRGTWYAKRDGDVHSGGWQVTTVGRNRGQLHVWADGAVVPGLLAAVRRWLKRVWDADHPGTRVDAVVRRRT